MNQFNPFQTMPNDFNTPNTKPFDKNYNNYNNYGSCCMKQPMCKQPCQTTYSCCPPIETCSKQVVEQYHIVKQPYIHNYHTEVIHHHVVEKEFIPKYTCSEVHVNDKCPNARF